MQIGQQLFSFDSLTLCLRRHSLQALLPQVEINFSGITKARFGVAVSLECPYCRREAPSKYRSFETSLMALL